MQLFSSFLRFFERQVDCLMQRTPSCSKLHVCMLRRAAVPVAASGIIGRIVFICTCQFTSTLLASRPIIFARKIPLAAAANASFKASSPTTSFLQRREVFRAARYSHESQKVLHYSCAYHGRCLLPLSTVRSPLFQCCRIIRIALCDPESSSAAYVLVCRNCLQRFIFWYVRFPDRRGHPITDAQSCDLYELKFGASAALTSLSVMRQVP